MLRRRRVWIGIGLSLLLGLVALRGVQLGDLLTAMGRIEPTALVIAVTLYFVDLLLRAWRWRLLLGRLGHFSIWSLFIAMILGYAANNLLPVRAGDVARALAVSRLNRIGPAGVIGTVAIERLVDGLTIVALLAIMLPMVPGADWIRLTMLAGGVIFGLLMAVTLLVTRWRRSLLTWSAPLHRRLPAPLQARLLGYYEATLTGIGGFFSWPTALATLGLSLLIWLVGALIYLAVGLAFGIAVPLWWWIVCICLVNLATALPLAPAGLGAFELVLIELLVMVGIHSATAAAATITLHAVLVVPVVVAGLICAWGWGLSLVPTRPVVPASPARAQAAED